MDDILFVLIGFVGSFASAVFGFGTALLVLGVGSHVLPVKDAIALATVLFAASTVTKSLLFGRYIDWNLVGIMTLASLPFAYLGAELLSVLPGDLIKRMLGVMILIYLGVRLSGVLPAFRVGRGGLLAGSALYGFVSGLLGSGNLVKVILFREMNITKEAFVGAMAATSVMANVAKLGSYWHSGLLRVDMAWPAFGLVICAIVTSLIGRRILRHMNAGVFETGVQVVLVLAAVALLI